MKLKIFAAVVLAFSLFIMLGKVSVNGKEPKNIVEKFLSSVLVGLLVCLVFGLPILGLVYLFK